MDILEEQNKAVIKHTTVSASTVAFDEPCNIELY